MCCRVYLHLRDIGGRVTAKITFSDDLSFEPAFYIFVRQSFSVISRFSPFYDDSYSDRTFDVFVDLVDLDINALISFLEFMNYNCDIFYNATFGLSAIYNFHCDLEKLKSFLPS